jgi:hypothetical protein
MRVLAGKASREHKAALHLRLLSVGILALFKGGNSGSKNGRDKSCLVLVCKGLAAIYLKQGSLDAVKRNPRGDHSYYPGFRVAPSGLHPDF